MISAQSKRVLLTLSADHHKVSGDECTNAYESVLAKLVRGAEIPGNYFSTVSLYSEFMQ